VKICSLVAAANIGGRIGAHAFFCFACLIFHASRECELGSSVRSRQKRMRSTPSVGFTRMILTALVVLTVALPEALAQSSYPERPIRIIVPNSPGGTVDMIARLVAQGLTERLGRQVVVDNRPGAGTIIGSEIVAKAPPDGYTLLMSVSTLAIDPATYKKMPYDALRDFAPITQAAFVPNLFVVHPSVPAKSVKELIALAKARPGEIQYASAGHGSNPHLTMELFASMAQIRLIHVPYKGGTPAFIDLIAGRVSIMATNLSSIMPHVRAGKLRALGVTSTRRVAVVPDIPTIAEAALPGFESVQWYGLLAPAKTPRQIVERLHKEVVAILRAPDTAARLASDGAEVVASSPEEFAAFLKAETVKWAKVVKAAGIQPE
jgi:tripartite-type tricarboxylate transporter receptor subunit TctC